MASPKKLTIPESRWEDVRALVFLPLPQLEALGAALASPDLLRRTAPKHILISQGTGLTNMQALQVLNAVQNLALQCEQYEVTDEELLSDLEAGLGSDVAKLSPEQRAALLALVRESNEIYLQTKAESLRTALIPHMISARTVCDLRPVFDRSRDNLTGGILVTYLEIQTHDEDYGKVTVQLSESDLDELSQTIAEAQKKLARMKARFSDLKLLA